MTKHQTATIRATFKRHFNNNPNLMTPGILGYGQVGSNLLWELSTGDGIPTRANRTPPPLYAVTVLQIAPGDLSHPAVSRYDLSQCFTGDDARAEANAYIRDGFQTAAQTDALAAIVEAGEAEGLG